VLTGCPCEELCAATPYAAPSIPQR
jgi:hypothetical protein